jgi:hypothetical protein
MLQKKGKFAKKIDKYCKRRMMGEEFAFHELESTKHPVGSVPHLVGAEYLCQW